MDSSVKRVEIALSRDVGADVNARDSTGRTALHWAAIHGHERMAALVLDRRADLEARDHSGKTAMDLAEGNEVADILKVRCCSALRQFACWVGGKTSCCTHHVPTHPVGA